MTRIEIDKQGGRRPAYLIALAMVCGLSITTTSVADTITAPEQSDLTIAQLSQEVSDKLTSLREFESYPIPDSVERRKILDVRRDEKTIAVLQRQSSRDQGC